MSKKNKSQNETQVDQVSGAPVVGAGEVVDPPKVQDDTHAAPAGFTGTVATVGLGVKPKRYTCSLATAAEMEEMGLQAGPSLVKMTSFKALVKIAVRDPKTGELIAVVTKELRIGQDGSFRVWMGLVDDAGQSAFGADALLDRLEKNAAQLGADFTQALLSICAVKNERGYAVTKRGKVGGAYSPVAGPVVDDARAFILQHAGWFQFGDGKSFFGLATMPLINANKQPATA